jgi:cytochrome oxidase Cu insertion factor (SCO1/SenC/PrrC family)
MNRRMLSLSASGGRLYSGGVRALAILVGALALVAVACGGDQSAQDTTTTTTTTETATGKHRPQAPPVAGTTLDGESLALADFRGTPVLVNVWSSW